MDDREWQIQTSSCLKNCRRLTWTLHLKSNYLNNFCSSRRLTDKFSKPSSPPFHSRNSPRPPMFQNTDGISKHRLSPYTAFAVYVYYLYYKHCILFSVSGSNCNLIFVFKSFSVVHCMQLSHNTFHLSTILCEKKKHASLYPIYFFWTTSCYDLFVPDPIQAATSSVVF